MIDDPATEFARGVTALIAALLIVLAASACHDEADPVLDDPEKRVSASHACRAQAEAWCVAFQLCHGNSCEPEFCVPAFHASCLAQRDEPIEVSRLLACLAAIDDQSCDVVTPDREAFGLPEACLWEDP